MNKVLVIELPTILLLLIAGVASAHSSEPVIGWALVSSGGGLATSTSVVLHAALGEPVIGSASGDGGVLDAGYSQRLVDPAAASRVFLPLIVQSVPTVDSAVHPQGGTS